MIEVAVVLVNELGLGYTAGRFVDLFFKKLPKTSSKVLFPFEFKDESCLSFTCVTS